MVCRINELNYHPIDTLDEQVDIQDAASFMAARNLGSVVVTRKGGVAGLFTEADLVRRVIGRGLSPKAVTLGEVCSRKLISLHEDTSCENAVKTMHSHQCRRLLVYRGETLRGLITMSEVAEAMASNSRRSNALLNIVGAITLLVTLGVIGLGIYQLPDMARLALAVMN